MACRATLRAGLVALGIWWSVMASEEFQECARESPMPMFLQMDLRTHSSAQRHEDNPANGLDGLTQDMEVDEYGHACYLCNVEPFSERMEKGRVYHKRKDCGNHSLYEHPENSWVPVHTFNLPGSPAYCELNHEKACADAMYNQDFLYWAKSFDVRDPERAYYKWACVSNGWLQPEFVRLQHDYGATQAKSDELCASERYLQYDWNTTMTSWDAMSDYMKELGNATVAGAERMEAYKCAMGSLGCDIALCVYSFCIMPDGSIGVYDECDGWDPVRGMPPPSI